MGLDAEFYIYRADGWSKSNTEKLMILISLISTQLDLPSALYASVPRVWRSGAISIEPSDKHAFAIETETCWRYCAPDYPRGPAADTIYLCLALQQSGLGEVYYGGDNDGIVTHVREPDFLLNLAEIASEQVRSMSLSREF